MKVVFATGTVSVSTPAGGQILVMEGTHWSEDDPIVRENPSLFSADARYGMLFSHPLRDEDYPGGDEPMSQPRTEQMTATPGQMRRNPRHG